MNSEEIILVGKKAFPGVIDITDPCYDKDVWCRYNGLYIVPGVYDCFMNVEQLEHRVSSCSIFLEGVDRSKLKSSLLTRIGVDAGLAGFFFDKPDYTDDQWKDFCERIDGNVASIYDEGFFTSSGYGDGEYPVIIYKDGEKVKGVEIKFIEAYEDEDDDDDEFDDFVTDKCDLIDNAAYELLQAIAAETPYSVGTVEWDYSIIGEVIDYAESLMNKKGERTCHPYFVDDQVPCYLDEDCTSSNCPFKAKKDMSNLEKDEIRYADWVHGENGTHCSNCGYTVREEEITLFCPECRSCMDDEYFEPDHSLY